MMQSVHEQIGTLPAIEAKLHLFEVGRKMLRADSVPRSHDAAFEQGERGFDGVRVYIAHDVDAAAVLNRLVIFVPGLLDRHGIRGSIVGHNHVHIFADVFADEFCEGSRLGISGMEKPHVAVALPNTENYFFVVHAGDAPLALVPAAYVSSIQFDGAIQHRLLGSRHGVTDAMAEIPRGLVTHPDRALNLASRHSLFRFAEQVSGEKPFGKGQVRIVEHRPRRDGKLIVAFLAVEELLVGFQFDGGSLAAQALRAFGPAQTNEQSAALFFSREKGVYIN